MTTETQPQQIHHADMSARGAFSRRNVLQFTGAGVVAAALFNASSAPALAQAGNAWDKTFPKSDRVDHHKVTFKNRYGILLAGDLYVPKQRGNGPLPALAIAGPFGAVKEQSAGLYAQTMAERGYVALAFDPSYVGRAEETRAASLRPTSTRRTSALPSTISGCNLPWIGSVSG